MSANSPIIRLGFVDDHNLFREGIKSLLDKMNGVSLILEAGNGEDLFKGLEHQVPDVLLLDLELGDMDGIEITKRLKVEYPKLKVIILTMHKEERMISYLMEIGAAAYLLKDTGMNELETAINMVFTEGFYLSELVSTNLLKVLQNKRTGTPELNNPYYITERELDVLKLISQEFTTSEIAEKLFLSDRTIEGYRKNLISKLGVKNSAGLIMKAIQENIIQLKISI